MFGKTVFLVLLEGNGFTKHEAHCIFHKHIAPLNEEWRTKTINLIFEGIIKRHNWAGNALLKGCPGL